MVFKLQLELIAVFYTSVKGNIFLLQCFAVFIKVTYWNTKRVFKVLEKGRGL